MIAKLRAISQTTLSGKLVAALLVFIFSGIGYLGDIGTTQAELFSDSGVVGWIYYTASLFVFGGTDMGLPVYQGYNLLAYYSLWASYLLAPLVTTTVVADALIKLIKTRDNSMTLVSDHLILIGSSDLAEAYLRAVKIVEPEKQVLWVRQSIDFPPEGVFDFSRKGDGIIQLDINLFRGEALAVLMPDRASHAVLICDADLTNLEVGWLLYEACPSLVSAVHVADSSLLRPVNRIVKEALKAGGVRPPSAFSMHRIASLQLYDEKLAPHFEQTEKPDHLVIVGFGRFAHTVLELISVAATDQIKRCIVVAPAASRALRKFTAEVPIDEFEVVGVDGVLDDPKTWDAVAALFDDCDEPPVVVFADADALTNFRIARLANILGQDTRLFLRCFNSTGFTVSLADQMGIELLCFKDMLDGALQDHYEALTMV